MLAQRVDHGLRLATAALHGTAPDMRQQHHPLASAKGFGHIRLGGKDVEAGTRDRPALDRRHQRLLIDDATARYVDEAAILAQCPQDIAIDEVSRLHSPRTAEQQEVTPFGRLPAIVKEGVIDVLLARSADIADL